MKRCPQCNRVENDEALKFCRIDGTALVNDSSSFSDAATAQLGSSSDASEVHTSILPNNTNANINRATAPTSVLPASIQATPTLGKTKRRPAAILILVIVMAVFAIVGAVVVNSFLARDRSTAIDSVAVLPFENRSGSADSEYLSDGLAESLIYRLSQLPNLKVSPTSSVMRYKGKGGDLKTIANELGVNAVMTGKLVQRGDNLTISVELVDVRNNKLLWGEQYDRKMADLLATQREIAASIAQKLQPKLAGNDATGSSRRYTDNNEAYQLYLKGRFHFARRTNEDMRRSIELFDQAIRLDPNFALAYQAKAESYGAMPSYPYMSPREGVPQARAAISKALALDPQLAEAHTTHASSLALYDRNWPEAEREFMRSLELDSNLAVTHFRYGWNYLSPLGRHDEAIAEMKRAMDLEPLSVTQGANFAAVLMYARQFDAAVEQAKKTYELDPNHPAARNWMCHTLNAKGRYADSLLISEKVLQFDQMFAAAAYSYAKTGQRQKAEETIRRLKEAEKTRYVQNYWVAILYAALGDKDEAFLELEKAYRSNDWFLSRLKVDPFMDPLRDDPRFNDLVKRIGLPN